MSKVKTKIVSFQPVTRELRAALKVEGFDGPVTNNTSLWDDVLLDVESIAQTDDPRALLNLGCHIDSDDALTAGIRDAQAPPHVFILPRGRGDVGLLRALVLNNLQEWADDPGQREPPVVVAYVWSPYSTKLAKVFPSPESED